MHQYLLDIVPLNEKKIYCEGAFNHSVLRTLESWPHWPSPIISLYGPSGSGKTHLLELWGQSKGAIFMSLKELELFRDHKELNKAQIIILDDFENIRSSEANLFHFYNWIGEQKKFLIIISVQPLAHMTYGLKDLESRFKSIPSFEMGLPSDEILLGYMRRYFESHQLVVSESLLEMIFRRLERSFGSVCEFCVCLNREALRYKKPITRGLSMKILEGFLKERSLNKES